VQVNRNAVASNDPVLGDVDINDTSGVRGDSN
jgi:hypothetical protein